MRGMCSLISPYMHLDLQAPLEYTSLPVVLCTCSSPLEVHPLPSLVTGQCTMSISSLPLCIHCKQMASHLPQLFEFAYYSPSSLAFEEFLRGVAARSAGVSVQIFCGGAAVAFRCLCLEVFLTPRGIGFLLRGSAVQKCQICRVEFLYGLSHYGQLIVGKVAVRALAARPSCHEHFLSLMPYHIY